VGQETGMSKSTFYRELELENPKWTKQFLEIQRASATGKWPPPLHWRYVHFFEERSGGSFFPIN
jgi:hypothetical protein